MLNELSQGKRVVGIKQCRKCLRDGSAVKAFMAKDASRSLLEPLLAQCSEKGIPVCYVDTMKELGAACGIDVGAAIAVLIR